MPNQYTKFTRENAIRKMSRKTNPVTTLSQLTKEFGFNTTYTRSDGRTVDAPSGALRNRIRREIGALRYKRLTSRTRVS